MAWSFETELLNVIDCLKNAGLDYAICGGVAVGIHGFPRATVDIDMLMLERDIDKFLEHLEALDYILPAGTIPFNVGKPTASRIFLVSKVIENDLLTLDLMYVSERLMPIWEERILVRVGDREVQVVSLEGLLDLKKQANHPQDLADIDRLTAIHNEPKS